MIFLLKFFILFFKKVMNFIIFCYWGKSFDLVLCTIFYCVGAEISTLMSISDKLDLYTLSKDGKMWSMKEKTKRKVFI